MLADTSAIIRALRCTDPAFRRSAISPSEILEKRLSEVVFADTEFERRQVAGTPCLFFRTPTPLRAGETGLPADQLLLRLFQNCDQQKPIRVLLRERGDISERSWRPRTIVQRWVNDNLSFGVIDLAVGRTQIGKLFDWKKISVINLLAHRSPKLGRFELCGPVVATSGHITNSHVDDPDIWNTCAHGVKVWFMWDLSESITQGVGDPRLEPIDFRLSWFAKMKSSRVAVVHPGSALYVPSNYVHRVVTIEKYIGAGSFFVSHATGNRQLRHWKSFGASWVLSGEHSSFVDDVSLSLCRGKRRASLGYGERKALV